MSYGWVIDIDHMPDESKPEGTNLNAKGMVGPRDIPDWMEEALVAGARWVVVDNGIQNRQEADIYDFRIYDSNGELYYSGRMITDENPPGDEACGGPLDDFGQPNAGASEIRYPGHPEMDIG